MARGSGPKLISTNQRGFIFTGLVSMGSKDFSRGRSNFENLISTNEKSIINQRLGLGFTVPGLVRV